MRISLMLPASACLLFAIGCEQVDSEGVATSAVYATMTATADGDGTTEVVVGLKVGGSLSNTYLDLSGDDALEASSLDESMVMTKRRGLFNDVYYTASFPGDEEDKEIAVNFKRSADEGAPASSVTLPAAFDITTPTEDGIFARATDAIEVTWEPAGGDEPMLVEVSGPCVETESFTDLEDNGMYTIPEGTLVALDEREDETCVLNLRVSRSRTGTLDPAYEGGRITAVVVREVTFSSSP